LLSASKNLDNLIESQRSDKSKEGLGYTFVPPLVAQLYLSPKKDLSWTGFPKCADDTVTDYSRPSPTIESSSEEDQNINPSASENVASPITPKQFVKFVKASDSQSKSKTDENETPEKPPVKNAEQYRKSNKKPNATYPTYLIMNHLMEDICLLGKEDAKLQENELSKLFLLLFFNSSANFWQWHLFSFGSGKQSSLAVRTYTASGNSNLATGLPECADDTVTVYSKLSPTVECSSEEDRNRNPSVSEKVASPNTPKPLVKFVKASDTQSKSKTDEKETPKKLLVKYAEQYIKLNKKPNVRGNQRNWNNLKSHQLGPDFVMKKKACFNCGDFNHLAYECRKRGSSQNHIDDKGYWDSGCSRHMTGNISYLSDYEPFDEGYVSFGQGGCKITEKGTIKTGKLEFENVYFVKDLKRLGHLNYKTMNKLVRHNLFRGLPTKCFENDHNCTACLKGKQHKESCKSKLVTSMSKPLHTLHMDLFDPTSDETSDILKKFITEIENLKDLKVKIISNATPQQNGVAERRNRSLIEAARTMLADAKLPITFRVEAVNTACYVQNRVLVNKADNKTPYELFNGRTPAIGFLKPFGCHVMILNTLDNLGTKVDARQYVKKDVSSLRYIVLPNWVHEEHLESPSSQPQDACNTDAPKSSRNSNPTATLTNPPANQLETLTVETPIPTDSSRVPTFEDILRVTSNEEESNGVEADLRNMETTITASPTPTLRIHRDHSKSQIISPVDTPIQTRNKSKEVGEQCFIATIHQKTDPALLKFCLFSCFLSHVEPKKIYDALQDPSWVEAMQEELLQFKIQKVWSLVDCPKGPPRFQDPEYLPRVYKVEKAIYGLHQAPKAWYGSQSLVWYIVKIFVEKWFSKGEFKALMHEKFQMSAMGELNFLLGLRLISWQCKKQTIIATSITEAEYIVAASCCGQVSWIQNQLLDYGDCFEKKLINVDHIHTDENVADLLTKPFDAGRFQYLVVEHALRYFVKGNLHIYTSFSEHNVDFHHIVDFVEASPLRQYTQKARIAQSSALLLIVDEPASPVRDDSQGEACPTDSGFIADQDRATIAKSSTLPHDSAPRVTSHAAEEGKLLVEFQAQEVEINRLKERVKILEDKEGVIGARSGDDAPIKGRRIDEKEVATKRLSSDTEEVRLDEGEVAAKKASNDTEEMATVLTTMDAATVLACGAAEVPTGSRSIPTAGPPAAKVPTGSDVVPTASSVFATATVIDAQIARELKEQLEREDQRRSEQIARDEEITRIHAEEELQIMIDGLDRSNEVIFKHLAEYNQAAADLTIGKRMELINKLVKYQDHHSKILQYQAQQKKPKTKKQKRDFYMTVIRNNLGWKEKDFKGMSFKEVEAKFKTVWEQIEGSVSKISKGEAAWLKRKGIGYEQESAKKQKISEDP
nr:hypothetical protein [Tanacetum cinerariifolium]